MKEVMAFIRQNKVNITKESLANAGFPSFSCRKCLGRGKKGIDYSTMQIVMETGEIPATPVGEHLTESYRLIPKRVITLIVNDDDVNKVIDTLIKVNSTGNPGDGKIFVLPVEESFKIRTGESVVEAY
jgi:nitrogen regulatory protein PII 2